MVDDSRAEGTFSGFAVNINTKIAASVLHLGSPSYRHLASDQNHFFLVCKSPKNMVH